METLYAAFADASLAEKAAGALLDYGVREQDISFVANDEYGEERGAAWNNNAASYADAGGTGYAENRFAQAGDRTVSANYNDAAGWRSTQAGSATSQSYADPYVDEPDDDDRSVEDHAELSATRGISTTTPGDAGAGAAKGAGIGLGIGILAGLAALVVPGVGLVFGGGALASAIGAAAATTAAGAVAGGVTGYLKDQGVPDEAVQRYQGAIENGGAVLAITLPSGNVNRATSEQILLKYGAGNLEAY